jgi:hypothetical protein
MVIPDRYGALKKHLYCITGIFEIKPDEHLPDQNLSVGRKLK